MLTLTPTVAVSAGVGYLHGTALFGVAVNDVAANAAGAFVVENVGNRQDQRSGHRCRRPRVWDAAAKVVNKTTTGQQCVGVAVEAAANPLRP